MGAMVEIPIDDWWLLYSTLKGLDNPPVAVDPDKAVYYGRIIKYVRVRLRGIVARMDQIVPPALPTELEP